MTGITFEVKVVIGTRTETGVLGLGSSVLAWLTLRRKVEWLFVLLILSEEH